MTRCKQQKLAFEPVAGRRVEGRFDGKRLSTDGGLLLVREVASACRFFTRLKSCFIDTRNQDAIAHKDPVKNSTRISTANEVMQRIASVRRIYLSFTESFPSKDVFRHVLQT